MYSDPFIVDTVTEEKVTTQQKVITGVLIATFVISISAIAVALYYSLT